MLQWNIINQPGQVAEIIQRSFEVSCLIFKHSTRCSISSMAKMRLESDWDIQLAGMDVFFLDLLAYRNISNLIAEQFAVYHESPQILLIQNGECSYDASHLDISAGELREMLDIQ